MHILLQMLKKKIKWFNLLFAQWVCVTGSADLAWLCFQETNCRINYDAQRNTNNEKEELIISATEDTINILWMIQDSVFKLSIMIH